MSIILTLAEKNAIIIETAIAEPIDRMDTLQAYTTSHGYITKILTKLQIVDGQELKWEGDRAGEKDLRFDKGPSSRAYINTNLPNPGQNCNHRIENPQTLKVKFTYCIPVHKNHSKFQNSSSNWSFKTGLIFMQR